MIPGTVARQARAWATDSKPRCCNCTRIQSGTSLHRQRTRGSCSPRNSTAVAHTSACHSHLPPDRIGRRTACSPSRSDCRSCSHSRCCIRPTHRRRRPMRARKPRGRLQLQLQRRSPVAGQHSWRDNRVGDCSLSCACRTPFVRQSRRHRGRQHALSDERGRSARRRNSHSEGGRGSKTKGTTEGTETSGTACPKAYHKRAQPQPSKVVT